MTVRMGFTGFGKSASRYHLPHVMIRETLEVKTIPDLHVNEKAAAPFKERGVNFTTDLNELLTDPKTESITIYAPAHTYYDLAKQAILVDKSVIVEKPFYGTLEHAEELSVLGQERGVVVMSYQNRHSDGDYLVMKQVVEQGFLGEINEVETHIDYYRPGSTTEQEPKGDGSFYRLNIHLMDCMITLLGYPDQVTYDIRNNEVNETVDNYSDVDLHYGSKLKVKVKTNHSAASSYPRFVVHGSNGSFIKYGRDRQENDLKAGIMPDAPGFGEDSPMYYGEVTYRNGNGDWIKKQIKTSVGDYGRYYDTVYGTLRSGAPQLVTKEQALASTEILEAGFLNPNPSVYRLKENQNVFK